MSASVTTGGAIAAALSLAGPAAFAQDREAPRDPGLGLSIGAGVTGFADDDADTFSAPGAAWALRFTLGTRIPLALEAAYTGSAQEIVALGLDDRAILLGSGLEAAARFNLAQATLTPYVVLGLGWKRYEIIHGRFNRSSVRGEDEVTEVPVGVGLSCRWTRLLIDLRTTYRAAVSEGLFGEASSREARLDTWSVTGHLGLEF